MQLISPAFVAYHKTWDSTESTADSCCPCGARMSLLGPAAAGAAAASGAAAAAGAALLQQQQQQEQEQEHQQHGRQSPQWSGRQTSFITSEPAMPSSRATSARGSGGGSGGAAVRETGLEYAPPARGAYTERSKEPERAREGREGL